MQFALVYLLHHLNVKRKSMLNLNISKNVNRHSYLHYFNENYRKIYFRKYFTVYSLQNIHACTFAQNFINCLLHNYVTPSNFTQIFYTSGSEHHLQSVNVLLDCCSDSILSDDTDTLQKSALFATQGTFWSGNDNTGVSQLGGFSNHTYNFQTFYLWFLLLSSILVS